MVLRDVMIKIRYRGPRAQPMIRQYSPGPASSGSAITSQIQPVGRIYSHAGGECIKLWRAPGVLDTTLIMCSLRGCV